MNYPFYIFLFQGPSAVNELTLGDWIHQEGQEDHRLGGRATWHLNITADRLVGPFNSWTSSPTNWSDSSMLTSAQAFTSPPIRLLVALASSKVMLGTCQLC